MSLALLATDCGGTGGGTAAAPKNFTYLSVTENTTTREALTALSKGARKAENDALPLKVATGPSSPGSTPSRPRGTPAP
jgi:raffinose/stachyose/melibiose transport system substrate-binding protein